MPQTELTDYQLWSDSLTGCNIRGLVLVCGLSKDFCAANTLEELNFADQFVKVFYKSAQQAGEQAISVPQDVGNQDSSSEKLNRLLGREFSSILFDARQTFDTNLFAGLSGTLRGGGELCLMLPDIYLGALTPIAQSPAKSIDQKAFRKNFAQSISHLRTPPILDRLLAFSLHQTSTAIVIPDQVRFARIDEQTNITESSRSNDPQLDQAMVVKAIVRVAKGHSRRPLVLFANRGRGKSASLGLAASQLLETPQTQLIVTAPNRSNLSSFYKHLAFTTNNKGRVTLGNGSSLSFVAVDHLLKEKPLTNLLLIDEAAAIPVAQLCQLTSIYNRIVFSTTTHGYEGNGKGFETRFKHKLLKLRPQARFTELRLPMRWSPYDQLEDSTFSAFLFNSALPSIQDSVTNQPASSKAPYSSEQLKSPLLEKFSSERDSVDGLNFCMLNRSQLARDEKTLESVFALLTNAHYQTRPEDLAQILTNEKLSTVVLFNSEQQVVAVALINIEGELSDDTCARIHSGKSRIAGELLPQSLMIHQGQIELGKLRYYRIMRIAVHPTIQARGLGSHLLAHIKQMAINNEIDVLGASFAAEAEVVNFWLKNGFNLVRIGGARDSSSGAFSGEVIVSLKPAVQELFGQLTQRFGNAFRYKLKGELRDLDTQVLFYWLYHKKPDPQTLPDTHSQIDSNSEIGRFCQGALSLANIDWLVEDYLWNAGHRFRNCALVQRQFLLLLDLFIKQIPIAQVSKSYQLTGKKELITVIRKDLAILTKPFTAKEID